MFNFDSGIKMKKINNGTGNSLWFRRASAPENGVCYFGGMGGNLIKVKNK